MGESADSLLCFQMAVSLVSGVIGKGNVYAYEYAVCRFRCSHIFTCIYSNTNNINPEDWHIEGVVCAQDMIKGETQQSTAKDSLWCLELLVTLRRKRSKCLSDPKHVGNICASDDIVRFYKQLYMFNFSCDALSCHCTKKCKNCLFQTSHSLSLSLSLSRSLSQRLRMWLL